MIDTIQLYTIKAFNRNNIDPSLASLLIAFCILFAFRINVAISTLIVCIDRNPGSIVALYFLGVFSINFIGINRIIDFMGITDPCSIKSTGMTESVILTVLEPATLA